MILNVEAEARKVHLHEVEGCTCYVKHRDWIQSPLVTVEWRTGREEAPTCACPIEMKMERRLQGNQREQHVRGNGSDAKKQKCFKEGLRIWQSITCNIKAQHEAFKFLLSLKWNLLNWIVIEIPSFPKP